MARRRQEFIVDSDSEDEMLVHYLYNMRREKVIRPRKNNFEEWDDDEFKKRYRLSKVTTMGILEEIRHAIEFETDRNSCLPPAEQLLLTLRYCATNASYTCIGDLSGVHKTTAGRIINTVTSAIAALRPQYVTLPGTREEARECQQRFFEIAAFPRVLGALDCTHVRIKSPGGDEAEMYRNRKGFFSLNVQTLVDADLFIRDIVARWPGSAHDSTIFNHSRLRARLERNEFGNSVVLCDSAYAVSHYLLPPLQAPQLQEEQLYNEAQIRSRNVVERCYGVLKARFPILSLGMQTNIQQVQNTVVACAVLHNIARRNNEDVPPIEADVQHQLQVYLEEENILADLEEVHDVHAAREATRRTFVQYFRNRVEIPRV